MRMDNFAHSLMDYPSLPRHFCLSLYVYMYVLLYISGVFRWCDTWLRPGTVVLYLIRSKLRLCSANHRAGYFSNMACVWLRKELTPNKRQKTGPGFDNGFTILVIPPNRVDWEYVWDQVQSVSILLASVMREVSNSPAMFTLQSQTSIRPHVLIIYAAAKC